MASNGGNENQLAPAYTLNLRSEHSTYPLLAQFMNRTGRMVELIWIDYGGHWIRYKILSPGDHFEIYTFVTHPWVFRDTATGVRLTAVDYGPVFIPTTHDVQQVCDPEGSLHLIPTLVSICVPVYGLKDRCIETIHRTIVDKSKVQSLIIPQELKEEVLRRIHRYENERILPAGTDHSS